MLEGQLALVQARVQELARAPESVRHLERELARAQAQAAELERKRKWAYERFWQYPQWLAGLLPNVTKAQYQALDQQIARANELARQQKQAQARVEALERELVRAGPLAMELMEAQQHEQEVAQQLAEAGSLRYRVAALLGLVWQFIRAPRGAWAGVVRSLYLGMGIVALPVWMLPSAARARWKDEAYVELELLKQEDAPLLGNAIRIALRTPLLALVLWISAWGRSRTARWLAHLEPLWIGLGWAAGTFLAAAAGIFPRDQSPSGQQVALALAASLLVGGLTTWEKHKGRRTRKRKP